MKLTISMIREAMVPSPWSVGNDVLYELCQSRPTHSDEKNVIAKIWLIGRSYAAAIERRKNKSDEKNDDFYENIVAPAIVTSSIDEWINKAKRCVEPCDASLGTLLQVHYDTTELFSKISDLKKRSLASKYLHFHVPQLFYIYDTRAVGALRMFSDVVSRAGKQTMVADNEYRKFAVKCLELQKYIKNIYKMDLSPRQLDNLLMQVIK